MYAEGIVAIKSGNYQKAIEILSDIEGYKDSSYHIQYAENLIDMERAKVLVTEGLYEQATDILLQLKNVQNEEIRQSAQLYLHRIKDIQDQENMYVEANAYQEEGDYIKAISLYRELVVHKLRK